MGEGKTKAGKGKRASAKPGARLASAIALHQRGQLKEAEEVYLALLEADHDNPDALHYLGLMRFQQGQCPLAIDLVRRALQISPDYVDAYSNLGNIYQQLNGPEAAAELYRKALALRPDHPPALHNLGLVLRQLKRFEEAIGLHQRAIENDPRNLQSLYALSQVYKEMGRPEEAVGTLKKALAIRPDRDGFRRLGQMLYALHRIEEAAANYEGWLRVEPDSPVAKHMLAACTLKDVPIRAGDGFVTQVFDGFAESFDRVLHSLEYLAPALVADALQRTDGPPRGELDIVDAGCGTGLLAQHVRPYARRLVGVDLSPRMLEKAAKRALYDELVAAELASFLRSSPGAFDVVASSDTLVYFGELRDVLAAACAALRPGGRLLFTLERAADEALPEGYCIRPHGRYSHAEPYVRATLAEAGFEVIEICSAHLRREGARYVEGLVVLARLPARLWSEA
jgi:predicted TPR repeat methyltransferase